MRHKLRHKYVMFCLIFLLTPFQSSKFWILVAALRTFVNNPESDNRLPLSGVLPDMKADTSGFIAMQHVYLDKAKKDRETFRRGLDSLLDTVNLSRDLFTQDDVEIFCKNARYIKVIFGTCFSNVLNGNIEESEFCTWSIQWRNSITNAF